MIPKPSIAARTGHSRSFRNCWSAAVLVSANLRREGVRMDRYGRAPAMEGSPSDPAQEWTGPAAETGLEGGSFGPAFYFRLILLGEFCFYLGFVVVICEMRGFGELNLILIWGECRASVAVGIGGRWRGVPRAPRRSRLHLLSQDGVLRVRSPVSVQSSP